MSGKKAKRERRELAQVMAAMEPLLPILENAGEQLEEEEEFIGKLNRYCEYLSYKWMNELTQRGVFFVTRARNCFHFKVRESTPTDRTRGYICDQIISPKGARGEGYSGCLRRVSFRDPDTKKKLVFLTNRFDLATKTICDLYKARWKVELFFKTLKQNLKIKKFLGISANAVKAQIWTALIAYLLVQLIRFKIKTTISIPDVMAVLGTLALLKEPLTRILGDLPKTTRYPPPLQLNLRF